MIIICLHGYFIFREQTSGEIATFNSYYDETLTAQDDYYTFAKLTKFTEYSLLGKPIINLPAIKTYCGKPWEILKENKYVYSIKLKLLIPLYSIVSIVKPTQKYKYKFDMGLIQPGSLTPLGQRITGYQCQADMKTLIYNYTELFYDEIL